MGHFSTEADIFLVQYLPNSTWCSLDQVIFSNNRKMFACIFKAVSEYMNPSTERFQLLRNSYGLIPSAAHFYGYHSDAMDSKYR